MDVYRHQLLICSPHYIYIICIYTSCMHHSEGVLYVK